MKRNAVDKPHSSGPSGARKVLLVGWDAADWKVIRPLMGAGEMPNVQRLVANGASGQIATLHPPISPMLWTSIATGKRPFQHGILGFIEPVPGGTGVRPVTNLSRRSKALWNILNQNGKRSVVIGWWPSHPAEPIDGVMISDQYHRAAGPLDDGWPLAAGTVHPPELAETLAAVRVHPDQLTPPIVERFVPLAREIDQDRDQRLAALLRTLAECMSIQAAALWLVEHAAWDLFAVYFDAIDHFCHSFMRYHPPRQSWIGERDFELYSNVVSMAYQVHDEMLGALLARAGTGVTVVLVSDHGFHPDHLRPASIPEIPAGPTVEHRDFGVLAISGPGIRENATLHGASVLDVTPTILTLYGLPVGEDMDGKILSQAFADELRAAYVPSWEDVPGADGRHPPHTRLDPIAAQAALDQMVALGYVERPDRDSELAVKAAIRDQRYNLGEAYQDAGRHTEAHAVFTGLCRSYPDEQRFAVRLFVSCQALGLADEMRRIVDDLDRRRQTQEPSVVDYLKAQVLTAEGRYEDALAAIEKLAGAPRIRPGLFLEAADLQLRLGRADEARKVFEKALQMDPDDVRAHLGLSRVALRARRYGDAAQFALDALQRNYGDPEAHFLLGRALTGRKEYSRAAESFRAAISFNPNYPEAHARLADLLEKHLDNGAAAREHRRLFRSMRNGSASPVAPPREEPGGSVVVRPSAAREMPPLAESLVVVTGLPRSGTSLLMQMLAAGGMDAVSDGLRTPDEDNPLGYFESARVKNLRNDSAWLYDARGKAVKIVAPLLDALPPGLPCRVILCERDLEEVLDSQARMLARRNQPVPTPEERRMLAAEYRRTVESVQSIPAQLLAVQYTAAIQDPLTTAERINGFLGGGLDVAKMAGAVDSALYRNRR
jgi:predicted AlkP superfamily phosphohydrolase/phosphomutase/tetratricopeptide (TPR) repeat protein